MLVRTMVCAGVAFFGMSLLAPAEAKTSIAKAGRICVEAVQKQFPNASSVRIDPNETRSGTGWLRFEIRVTDADGKRQPQLCTVDRKTAIATLKPKEG